MNKFNYLIIFVLLISACENQNPDPTKLSKGIIQFDNSSFDFGKLNENDHPVTHQFVFKNIGSEPLFIKNVKASCGCTSPSWSKNAIVPGDTGYVEAIYNPKGHPGAFNKSLMVSSNTVDSTIGLFIAGNVIEKIKTIEEIYKDTLGNIRIDSRYINLDIVNNKEIITKEYKIYNASQLAVTFGSVKKIPSYLKVSFIPKVLPSNKEGIIRVLFDPKTKIELGKFGDEIIVSTNDKLSPSKSFFVSGMLTEYFPTMTEQELANAPKLILDKTIHDFGKIKKGTKATTKFYIKNEGNKDLKIRKLEPSCYCTTTELNKTTIRPQETGIINVIYDTKDLSLGPDTKSVKIYCNDPINSTLSIVINGTVIE